MESPKACSSCGGTLVYFTPLVCKECKNYFGVESTTLAEVVGNLLQQTTDRIDKLEKQNASLQLAVEQLKSAMSAGGVALPDKETCCQAVKETPKEVLKETPKEVVAEAPKELQKEIPEEVPEEPLKEAEQTCKQTNNCATECKSSDSDDVTVLAEKFSSRQAAEEVLTLCHSNTANASKLSELFRYNHSQIKAAVNTFANDVQTVFKMLLVFGDNVSDTLEFVSKFGGNGVSAAAFMGSFADKDIAMVLLNFFSGDGVAANSFLDSFQRDGAAAVAFASCFEREKHLAQVVLKKFRGDGLLALKFQNHLTNNLNKTLEFLQVFSTGKDALTFLEQFKTIEEAMKMVAIFGGRGFDAASFMTIFKGDTSKAFLFLEKYSNNTHAALDTLHKFDNNVEKAIQFVNGFSDSDAATNLLEFFQNNSGMLEAYLKLVGIKDLTELYDTNKHEKSSAEFRRRVCGKGPTVTFVFGKKLLCGGVTFKSFEDTDDPELRSSDIFDDKCFLFSIMNPVLGLYPTKFDVKPDLADYAVRICPGSGPSFGYGVDLLTMFVDGRVECSSFPSSFPIEKESLFGPIGTNKCTATRVAVFSFNI